MAAALTNNKNENKNEEYIYSYDDGSVYMGNMTNNKKHGRGTLRTAAFVYGQLYTAESAEDNSHLVKWHEYIGNWVDDVMHGPGRHVLMRGDGTSTVIYDGVWENGTHIPNPKEEYFAD
jgi:hypothetical protein